MKIFPAIDLRGGRVVRLTQGDYDKMTVYEGEPMAQAAEFIAAFIKNDVSWAHLDIAGTAFKPSDALHGKGPTGFGVHLLIEAIHALTSTES